MIGADISDVDIVVIRNIAHVSIIAPEADQQRAPGEGRVGVTVSAWL